MFDKMKQLKQLRDLQKQMEQERYEAEKDGVRAVVNGGFQLEELSLNEALDISAQQKAAREAVNDALKKAQMGAAQKFRGMM